MSEENGYLGQVAYEAYGDAVHWTAYDGKRIATWEDQDRDRCAAWSAAGASVHRHAMIAAAAAMISTIPIEHRADALAHLAHAVELPPIRFGLTSEEVAGVACKTLDAGPADPLAMSSLNATALTPAPAGCCREAATLAPAEPAETVAAGTVPAPAGACGADAQLGACSGVECEAS